MSDDETKTEDCTDSENNETSRRAFLTGIVGLGAAGLFGAGRASAQSAPSGTVGTPTNPYLVAYVDRVNMQPRTSNPSSAEEGTMIFRGDL